MSHNTLLTVLLVSALTFGCKTETSGFLSCGREICRTTELCAATDLGRECVCQVGYRGEDCDVCDSGYRHDAAGGCVPIPIDCDDDPSICGASGQCTRDPAGDYCTCDSAHTGRLCESCASQYQDNDQDGRCEPSCGLAQLDCELPRRCSDVSGTAECLCPQGFTGPRCELCAEGYRYNGSTCVLTCEAAGLNCVAGRVCDDSGARPECVCPEGYVDPNCQLCAPGYVRDETTQLCTPGCKWVDLECGERGRCSQHLGFAACQCDLGYGGSQCDRCAEGYAAGAEGTCQFVPTAAFRLLAEAAVHGTRTLVALDPDTGETITLGERAWGGLAPGPTPGSAFATDGAAVTLLDVVVGEQATLLSNLEWLPALGLDLTRGRLLAVGREAPQSLFSLDPTTLALSEVGETKLPAILDLTYDAANDRLLALGQGLAAIDPTTAAVSPLPDLPPATRGIAVDHDGTLYALAATDLSANAARIDACRRSVAGIGVPGYTMATGSVVEPGPRATTLSLTTAATSGPEVVAYLGRDVTAGERRVTIDSSNPGAVVCLDIREPTTVIIPATARLGALIAYTVNSPVTVEVDPSFVPEFGARAIHLGSPLPMYAASLGSSVIYDAEDWEALALPLDARFYAPGPGVLHEFDEEFHSIRTVELPRHVRPIGTLTTWTRPE